MTLNYILHVHALWNLYTNCREFLYALNNKKWDIYTENNNDYHILFNITSSLPLVQIAYLLSYKLQAFCVCITIGIKYSKYFSI